jgi:anti-sigma factor ChrR (cupin superfamily)
MIRHASAEDLASLDLDALRSRKAARIRTHVAACVRCTELSSQVSAVPSVLAGVPYPSMPASFATQLDTALADESASRFASAPETEADRRDLPERRARRARGSWQLPGRSGLAIRLVAAAGALVVIGVGGYEIAAHTGGSVSRTAASSGSAAAPGARQMSLGPTVQYGHASSTETVQTVHSSTNFTANDLSAQALAAVRAAKLEGATGAHPGAAPAPAPTAAAGSATGNASRSQAASPSGLASCLDGLVGNRPVQLVETARFNGGPATIIVTKQTAALPAEVWAVGPACSASHPDVLAHQTLSRT